MIPADVVMTTYLKLIQIFRFTFQQNKVKLKLTQTDEMEED